MMMHHPGLSIGRYVALMTVAMLLRSSAVIGMNIELMSANPKSYRTITNQPNATDATLPLLLSCFSPEIGVSIVVAYSS